MMADPAPPADFPPQMRPMAFADFLGVSLKTVQRNIDRGMPVIGRGRKGFAKSIPVAPALAWLNGCPPKPRRGRPPNVSRGGDVQPASPHGAMPNAPQTQSPVSTPTLLRPYAPAPPYDPNVAMQRWKHLLLLDANARFAEDVATLNARQRGSEILPQRLKQCRIHKQLYGLAAEYGSGCTYSAAIQSQLIAEGLNPAELAGIQRRIAHGFIRDALSPDCKRGDLPPRNFVERFLRAQGLAVSAQTLEETYRECARSRVSIEAYMVGLYEAAISDPEFAKTMVTVQLPIVREFDGAQWPEPAYSVGDRIEKGQFTVEITDEAIFVRV